LRAALEAKYDIAENLQVKHVDPAISTDICPGERLDSQDRVDEELDVKHVDDAVGVEIALARGTRLGDGALILVALHPRSL
jgi:hypothetical protein